MCFGGPACVHLSVCLDVYPAMDINHNVLEKPFIISFIIFASEEFYYNDNRI